MHFHYQAPSLAGTDDGCPYCGSHDGLRGLGGASALEQAKQAKEAALRARQPVPAPVDAGTSSGGIPPLAIAAGVALVGAIALGVFKKKS